MPLTHEFLPLAGFPAALAHANLPVVNLEVPVADEDPLDPRAQPAPLVVMDVALFVLRGHPDPLRLDAVNGLNPLAVDHRAVDGRHPDAGFALAVFGPTLAADADVEVDVCSAASTLVAAMIVVAPFQSRVAVVAPPVESGIRTRHRRQRQGRRAHGQKQPLAGQCLGYETPERFSCPKHGDPPDPPNRPDKSRAPASRPRFYAPESLAVTVGPHQRGHPCDAGG